MRLILVALVPNVLAIWRCDIEALSLRAFKLTEILSLRGDEWSNPTNRMIRDLFVKRKQIRYALCLRGEELKLPLLACFLVLMIGCGGGGGSTGSGTTGGGGTNEPPPAWLVGEFTGLPTSSPASLGPIDQSETLLNVLGAATTDVLTHAHVSIRFTTHWDSTGSFLGGEVTGGDVFVPAEVTATATETQTGIILHFQYLNSSATISTWDIPQTRFQ